jgi:hypothetical protein
MFHATLKCKAPIVICHVFFMDYSHIGVGMLITLTIVTTI